MKKGILKLIILLVIIYLIISSIYIFLAIDFGEPPDIISPGFSEKTNIVRMFMGIPPTYSTYTGISPIHLFQIVIRLFIAAALLIFNIKKQDV